MEGEKRLEEVLQNQFSRKVLPPNRPFVCPSFVFPLPIHRRCKRACAAESLITVQELPPILAIRFALPHTPLDLPLTLDFAQFCSLVGVGLPLNRRTSRCRAPATSWAR